MKTKRYLHGNRSYRAYLKKVGKGYEIGFNQGTKSLFVGNFIHAKEATAWYSLMNKEITKFSKRYWTTDKASKNFYQKFVADHLYKNYYSFLDKWFAKYNREYQRVCKQDLKVYARNKKGWDIKERIEFKRAS